MRNVISLVPYYGGASSMVEVMRYLMESAHELGCTKLVETMAGSAVISINRDTRLFPSATLIEMDRGMGTLLKVMADSKLSMEFMKRVRHLVPSEFYFIYYKDMKDNGYKDKDGKDLPPLEIALAQYYLLCLSRNATKDVYSDRMIDFDNRMATLLEVKHLMEECTVYNDDCFNHILDFIHDEECLIVIDPPFLKSLRSSTGQYTYEWDDCMHEVLLDVLRKESYTYKVTNEDLLFGLRPEGEYIKDKPRAKIILFGFENEMYTKALTYAETPWYQFILEKPLLASNKNNEKGEKEIQRKSFWINFLPNDYAKHYVPELEKLIYLTPENLEKNLERDRKFKEDIKNSKAVKNVDIEPSGKA